MEKSFEIGDQVIVTGQPSALFAGETGTILDVTMRREDDAAYNVYWVAFRQKRVRMIGLYLRHLQPQQARQIC
jgi:ribosomal protein L21E